MKITDDVRIDFNGRTRLSDGRFVRATLVGDCADAGVCIDGFCQGDGQCRFGDCRNPLPETGAGTLCLPCSTEEWKVSLPNHWASVLPEEAAT